MKAAAFAYARAASVVNALELLAAHGEKAKVLSGGQSLIPAMNLRLVSPELIVDIGGLAELQGIEVKGSTLTIGALTRYVDIERSPKVAACAPLLVDAVADIAHVAIRNRGTIGGSLANADPAAELPACMLVLGATFRVRGPNGTRLIDAEDFFKGIYETALLPQELLIAVEIPVMPGGALHFFEEFSRRHGDFAVVGLAAQAVVEGGQFSNLRLGFFGVGNRPVLAEVAKSLTNGAVTPSALSKAQESLKAELSPLDDQQASAAMRRHLAGVLLSRAVAALLSRPDLRGGDRP